MNVIAPSKPVVQRRSIISGTYLLARAECKEGNYLTTLACDKRTTGQIEPRRDDATSPRPGATVFARNRAVARASGTIFPGSAGTTPATWRQRCW
jgi:hypothetical protein